MTLRAVACALLAITSLACLAPASGPAIVRNGRPAMGTLLEITVIAADRERAQTLVDECYARVAALEAHVSSWDARSDISQLNRAAGDGWIPVAPETVELLEAARGYAGATSGVFDVSVGPLLSLWREAEATGRPPDTAALEHARRAIGAERIQVEAGTSAALPGRAKLAPGMAIDLGGIAKGWALDRVGSWLRAQGVEHALLNFGGSSLLAMGSPPGETGWRVGIAARGKGTGVLVFSDTHVSISESFGQFREVGDQRVSHVIDPRTGEPIPREALAIAVGGSGATTEAWSTALLVLGEAGIPAALGAGLEVLVMSDSGTSRTAGFPTLVWRGAPGQ